MARRKAPLSVVGSPGDETWSRLAGLTDSAKFELLAAAVLREAEPIYRQLVHTGVNVAGRTVKSPLDGVLVVPDSEPLHFVAIHHTTSGAHELRRKWLSAKAGREGDLVKTIAWTLDIR